MYAFLFFYVVFLFIEKATSCRNRGLGAKASPSQCVSNIAQVLGPVPVAEFDLGGTQCYFPYWTCDVLASCEKKHEESLTLAMRSVEEIDC